MTLTFDFNVGPTFTPSQNSQSLQITEIGQLRRNSSCLLCALITITVLLASVTTTEIRLSVRLSVCLSLRLSVSPSVTH